jgi:hypothetical protein
MANTAVFAPRGRFSHRGGIPRRYCGAVGMPGLEVQSRSTVAQFVEVLRSLPQAFARAGPLCGIAVGCLLKLCYTTPVALEHRDRDFLADDPC